MDKIVKFSDFIQQISLPASNFIHENVEGFVVGYGKSELEKNHESMPKKIKIPITNNEKCYQSHAVFSEIKSVESFCAGKVGVVPCKLLIFWSVRFSNIKFFGQAMVTLVVDFIYFRRKFQF